MQPSDWAGLAAANIAGWHEGCLASLGLRSELTQRSWSCVDPRAPAIFFRWVTLGPVPGWAALGLEAGELGRAFAGCQQDVVVCDSWKRLDLRGVGFQPAEQKVWMLRPPGPPNGDSTAPSELEVLEVRDREGLALFEATSLLGFQTPAAPPFTFYGPGLLDDGRFRMWLGRVSGRYVGGSMSYCDASVNGVYSVSVIPEARRRGYGRALTLAATLGHADLPSMLQPSDQGVRMYRRMGYRAVTTCAVWARWSGPVPSG